MNSYITFYFKLHLIELKYNIFIFCFTFLYTFFICSYFSNELIYIFIKSLLKLNILKYFIYTEITEIFFLNFYLSFFITLIILLPFLIFQIWFFFLQGLKKKENLKIFKFIIIYNIFNIFIINLILFYLIPSLWIYFYNINCLNNYLFNIYFEPKLNNYFLFFISLYIYIYIIFLYPFILYILILFNIIKIQTFIFFRKIFYFKFLILTILIAPPDLLSQLLIILPFLFLFEIFLYFLIFLKKYII